ncbi:hypothetical protein D3C78_1769260 [compost metagenome]
MGGVQTIFTGAECQFRLVQVFRRQCIHRFGVDIRRVGDDQVVRLFQPFHQVAVDQLDAVFQAVVLYVDAGHFQRVQRDIDGVDLGVRIVVRQLDRQAT